MKKYQVHFGNLNILESGRTVVVWAKDEYKAEYYATIHCQYDDEFIMSINEIKE